MKFILVVHGENRYGGEYDIPAGIYDTLEEAKEIQVEVSAKGIFVTINLVEENTTADEIIRRFGNEN